MNLPRLLILPALATLLAVVVTPTPASAQAAECPCWPAGVPDVDPLICYVSPGPSTNTFAYLTPPATFLQATNFWCRNNAFFRPTSPAQSQACDASLQCLCENGAGVCNCEVQAFASGSADGANGEIGIVGLDDDSFTELGAGNITEGDERTVAGLTFDATGALFGSAVERGNSLVTPSNLILIDPSDGSRISTVGPIQYDGEDRKIVDLATRPSNDVLYGIDTEGNLYTLDKATAVATLIGSTTLSRGGIAFTPNGNLYLADVHQNFARLDPDTASPIGPVLDIDEYIDGLGARSDGLLFGTAQEDDDDIFQIDPATGNLVEIDGDEEISDIAFRCAPPQA